MKDNGAVTSKRNNLVSWLDDRIGWSMLKEFLSHKTVPMHRFSVFYYLGGMTLFFFMVQVCTGVLLMLYYRPSADEAFESIEFLVSTVPFGWLVRSIHAWSANLMVFFAFVHLVSVFFMKAYRPPRELTWVTGVVLLLLIFAFGFSGYLLPWNQLSFFATRVGTDIAGVVPGLGHWMMRFMRGGDRVTGATLSRFYGWHVAILPAITVSILFIHLALVQVKGMSVPPAAEEEAKKRPPMRFFPHFALRDLSGWIFALGVLAALAALMPWELGDKADPFAPAYANIRPEWYYVFMFQTLKLVPGGEIMGIEYEAIPIMLFGLAGLLLMLVPFLDRSLKRTWTIGGILGLIFVIAMTCWGYGTLVPLYIVFLSILLLGVFAWITRAPKALMVLILFVCVSARAQSSCMTCHEDKVAKFREDVHSQAGLSCDNCHGGNPKADMPDTAMDPKFKTNPYVGAPKRVDIPAFCGKCHSSAEFMKRFNPAARVDQVSEYRSSMHGQRLAKGDENVATCVDCHSVHDIKRKTNPESPIYPTHVAQTCSRCHSDAKRMASYHIPTDQYAKWKISVHANAMFEKNDLTAPTCNDCHGNHGATPPGVESVSFVCGTCHGREAELFRASAKHEGWTRHNDLLAGGSKCGDCHDDARRNITITHFSECITCHENHGIVRPSIAMVGALPDVPCAFCHEGTGQLASLVAEPPKKASHYRELRDTLLAAAARQNLKGDARFDWLVDQAQNLPTHKGRPEFTRLFEKFRIGKTRYGDIAVRRCNDCHIDNQAGKVLADTMHGLTSMIARAERIQLAAHRGGVETRGARAELDSAVDNDIEMEALVHNFGGKEVAAKQKEGLGHARAALLYAQHSLDELDYRRTGLFVALGIIIMVLAGLAMKIGSI